MNDSSGHGQDNRKSKQAQKKQRTEQEQTRHEFSDVIDLESGKQENRNE